MGSGLPSSDDYFDYTMYYDRNVTNISETNLTSDEITGSAKVEDLHVAAYITIGLYVHKGFHHKVTVNCLALNNHFHEFHSCGNKLRQMILRKV